MTDVQQAPARGLSAEQVRERVAAGQVNDVPRRSSRSVGEIVRANVFTRFNALIGSLFVLVLIFGAWQDGLFGGIIIANSAIGVIQELRAKRTLDKLAVVGETPVKVMRDGVVAELEQQEVVLGDLIMLGTGDKIVVDGAVVGSQGLEIDESLLTGEADPVHKQPGDEVKSGSFVVAGGGSFTADRVGRDAYAAQLVEEASKFSLSHSELMSGINTFLKYVTWLIIPTAILLFVTQLTVSKHHFGEAIVGAVAGVVTMIPEGLVLMTSIAFAVGVVRLGRRQCLVQELPAIEGLARVNVLCVDKTGTLTEPGMDLDQVVVLRDDLPGRQALAALAADDPDPNATMQAVKEGLDVPDPGWKTQSTVPFSSARKWSGAAFSGEGAWVFGAADVLLGPDDPNRHKAEELGSTGLRVLALARVPEAAFADPDALDVTASAEPAALIVLRQRLREEAPATLRYFEEQGVAVKVISGDNPVSVGAIARTLKLPKAEHPVDARTLPDDVEGMADVLEDNSVFGRVSPQQKRAMVKALQSRGHTVAMTGDGVNDVLALKDADLGVSMGSGSGATRAVAQIVLLDNSFATLPSVVGEGRRVLGNIERVANLFLTKTVYSIILAILVGIMHVRFPFLPRHLTLISTLTIGIPAFFLALAPNMERARSGFVPRVLRFAIPAGLACGIATFAGYMIATKNPNSTFEEDSSTATIALFLLALWVLLLIARPWNWWRLGLVAVMGAAFAIVLAVPWLRNFFALHPDNYGNDSAALLIAAAAAVLLTFLLRWDSWLTRLRQLREPAGSGGSAGPGSSGGSGASGSPAGPGGRPDRSGGSDGPAGSGGSGER
ncbi:HAD-IC family P-type ATPase [Actinomadura barringtoniae]|uniref:HAD-IC family P-type ATPase n=1 Tax=Actinomadura barringtoniae TaxID=1427535 RepID=A0A939P7W4_9ACTN|nr:HAD-IC family P-type ATPase [Actinomadura barringtoniae]MBO2447335.1 HAD-IC family P-type ATPase [Actinomadura barringtoniae]